MSLINDALKKAQSLNTVSPDLPQPATGPTQPITIPKRSEPMSAQKMVITLGIVIGTLLIMVVGLGIGFYVLYLKNDEPVQMATTEQPASVQTTEEVASVSIEKVTPVAEVTEIVEAVPVEVAETTPQSVVPIIEEKPKPWVNNPYPEVIAYVDSIKITGIRTSNGRSKVLMNNKIYKTGEIVNRSLGLKLTDVRKDELVFEDAEKNIYTAHF